jgi:hypothetical protein
VNDDELRSLRVTAAQEAYAAQQQAEQRAKRDTRWMWTAAGAAGVVIVLLLIAMSSRAG